MKGSRIAVLACSVCRGRDLLNQCLFCESVCCDGCSASVFKNRPFCKCTYCEGCETMKPKETGLPKCKECRLSRCLDCIRTLKCCLSIGVEIPCSSCKTQNSTTRCPDCAEPLCEGCKEHKDCEEAPVTRKKKKAKTSPKCHKCESIDGVTTCEQCSLSYCNVCDSASHTKDESPCDCIFCTCCGDVGAADLIECDLCSTFSCDGCFQLFQCRCEPSEIKCSSCPRKSSVIRMTCCKKPLCEECSDAHDCSHGKRVTRNSKKDTSKFVDFSAVEIDGDSEEEEDKEEGEDEMHELKSLANDNSHEADMEVYKILKCKLASFVGPLPKKGITPRPAWILNENVSSVTMDLEFMKKNLPEHRCLCISK